MDTETPLLLAPGVELFPGLENRPTAYVPASRRYVSLSPISAALVARLQRTDGARIPSARAALAAHLLRAADNPAVPAATCDRVLAQLERTGVLVPVSGRRCAAEPIRWSLLRLPVWRSNRVLLPPSAAERCRHLARPLAGLTGLAVLASLAAIVTASARMNAPFALSGIDWPLLAGGLVLHVIVHELAHGLAAGYYGIPVREFGVALLHGCIPVAYTDRTDAYRLRSFRAAAAIAAAGPLVDICAAGITAGSILLGWSAPAGLTLLACQIAILLTNLNPLLPGDGYHVLEALMRRRHVRRTAFALLAHHLLRSGPPGRFASLGTAGRIWHLLYAGASVLFIVGALALTAAAAISAGAPS